MRIDILLMLLLLPVAFADDHTVNATLVINQSEMVGNDEINLSKVFNNSVNISGPLSVNETNENISNETIIVLLPPEPVPLPESNTNTKFLILTGVIVVLSIILILIFAFKWLFKEGKEKKDEFGYEPVKEIYLKPELKLEPKPEPKEELKETTKDEVEEFLQGLETK